MIAIQGVTTIQGKIIDHVVPSQQNITLNAEGLTLLPGLIDPHVHFRTPGLEAKEDWRTAAQAAVYGGYTTVFDMPNTLPPTVTAALLQEKKHLINQQLKDVGIPLRYQLYFGADKHHLTEIHQIKNEVVGIKIFMGCSTGNLVVDSDESLHAIFAIAATQNLLVAVHAEDECRIQSRKKSITATTYGDHSHIRDVTVATIAVEKAINLSRIYGTRLYILHISSAEEVALVRQAKSEGLPVYAETTPHHLFLHDDAYASLQGKAVVNPPLRSKDHQQALFAAIKDGTIDTIGSDHAPHLLDEKSQAYGQCPSGMPGIETTLPLLLSASQNGLLSLENVLALTYSRARSIFNLPVNDDVVLVDTKAFKKVVGSQLKTKCAWSSFEGQELCGWPQHVVINGQYIDLRI